MHNMSTALRSAGVKVNDTKPQMTLAEARQLALRAASHTSVEQHNNEALSRLPDALLPLTEIRKGQEFVARLLEILSDRDLQAKKCDVAGFEINQHTVFGLSQLVHARRDALQGSRRKSFDRIIPMFLGMKKELDKNPGADPLTVIRKHLPPL